MAVTININYRIDIVGLSTDTKPAAQVENGSTFYTVDTQELYVYYAGQWYLQAPIETSSDNEETPSENSNAKKEEVKKPIEDLKPEPIEEPIEEPEPIEEKKSGDEK